MNISQDEILAALQQAMDIPATNGNGPAGVTVGELAVEGKSVMSVRRDLAALIKAGKAEAIRVKRMRMDGIWAPVPGYRLK